MRSSNPTSILMVDDQPGKLLTLESILSPLGEHLIKATSARQALDCLLNTDVAVVLIDVCMPELDGFELAQLIREHPRFHRTAIIFISAVLLSDADRIRGYSLGAVDYIPVPIIPEVLRAKVSVFVELHRKSGELQRLNAELERRVGERTAALEASAARLSESEDRLNLALDSAGAASWEWDVSQSRLIWTPRFRNLYGIAEDEPATLETWLGRVHPDHRPRLLQRIRTMLDRPGQDLWSEEFPIVHAGIGVRWLHGRGRLVRDEDGQAIRLTGIDLDVTERKRAEEDRVRLLEREREARSMAEQANRLKDEFLATVSHELRNPINTALLWVQLARRGSFSSASFRETLDGIERGIRTQTRLIDDLMDISRISAGKLRVEMGVVQLDLILQAALDAVLPAANSKGVAIQAYVESIGTSLRGDATRIQQVLCNLLDNGIKFTPKGGRIDVRVDRVFENAVISVTDTGSGIAREFLPFVFERFRQADSSTTRSSSGLGLGLAIVKNIVELHGGKITVESEGEGRGARFVVTLPMGAHVGPEPTGPLALPESGDLSGVRAIIVDDDPDTRTTISRLLEQCRAEVYAAETADDVLIKITEWHPHVLISDIGMPIKDGYMLIRDVRANETESHLPALALTAYARPDDRATALSAGFDAYCSKPVNTHELIMTIAGLVRSHPMR